MKVTWKIIFSGETGLYHHTKSMTVTPACVSAAEAMEVAETMVAGMLGINRHRKPSLHWVPLLHDVADEIVAYKAEHFNVVVAMSEK